MTVRAAILFLMPSINQLGKNLERLCSLRQLASVTQISTGMLDLLVDKEGAEVGWVGEESDRDENRDVKIDYDRYSCARNVC